ncbi:MAG: tetratricopeptide repeat protein, partial [bacterium]|nr:tetratricopeptide repeat protein [bacterium]
EEAAAIFVQLRTKNPDDTRALEGLERALRLGNDADGLVDLLADLASRADDPSRCAEYEMERATLLEDSLGAFDEAREVLAKLAARDDAREIAARAGERLEQLFTRSGEWAALRERLESRIGAGTEAEDLELYEELARLCRDRLSDRNACIEYLEKAGRIAPDRATIWHSLSLLYSELDRPHELLRVIEHELTLDLDDERETMLCARAARLAADIPHARARCGEHYERLLELEPGHAEASEFLLDHYEREDRPADMARLLNARLDAVVTQPDSSPTKKSSVVSLRLRIAALHSGRLDDHEAAVLTLEPAIEEVGPRPEVARPLADLYRRLTRDEDLIALCERAADACGVPEERATWLLEVGDTLCKQDESERAVAAYRGVLDARPNDRDAQSALRELYRELGDAESLVELLVVEAGRHRAADTIPIHVELARLFEFPLDRPEAALEHFTIVLSEDPRHTEAYLHCVELTRRLEHFDRTRELLEDGLAGAETPGDRAALLEQIGHLEAGPLDDPSAALIRYREAQHLDHSRTSVRPRMLEILTSLSRWSELLDCLFIEAQQQTGDERCATLERAVEIAARELSSDAALPWLERLHAERPEDADVLSRIADVHRQAGRPEALLRTLEAQLALRADPGARHTLHCDIAGILERDLASLGRAALALEAAHEIRADDSEMLADLDRLYDALGRHAERTQIIEERIVCEGTPASQLPTLHRGAARLWQEQLSSPETATRHLLHSIALSAPDAPDLIDLLGQLQHCLRASGRLDGWARAAERELELLTAARDPADDDRRYALHCELAACCDNDLARPAVALRHLLALLDDWNGARALAPEQIDSAETALIGHLRDERNLAELERRLAARLSRIDGSAEEWLELARLDAERLYRPSAARAAFMQVLERDPDCLDAIRGLRDSANRLGDWERIAESLERELALPQELEREDACAHLRRLGEIARTRLEGDDAPERAARAYRDLLDLVPDDLDGLHALQEVEEGRCAWTEAVACYEQEIALLGEENTERRQELWLRIAEIARDKSDEVGRAIVAFENAADVCELPLTRLREWAELHRTAGDWEHFAEVFARWCDAPNTPASCSDLLTLSEVLEELGQEDEALERAEMAIEADSTRATAFERAAALREARGDAVEAADHLAEAAELRDAATAVEHLLRATRLVFDDDAERCAQLLRRAADHDSACPETQARLAVACERLESWEEAETAAGRAIDLHPGQQRLTDDLLLEAALAGGRSAWKIDHSEAATRLFTTVCSLEPQNTEGLEALGELLYLSHDLHAAREALQTRLEMTGENPNRARQLAIVAEAFELDEEFDNALETFASALEADPTLDQAHSGIVRIHERSEEPAAAICALDEWIRAQQDDTMRSDALLRAAQLEQSIEETSAAIARLREASEANPANAGAWTLLADLLLRLDQPDAALEAATSGLAVIDAKDHASISTLAFVRGSTLEQGGDFADATTAYELAVENDPTHAKAVLGQVRLLRNSGQWQQAAETLGAFLEAHPQPSEPTLAQVAYERGQLLAGPLEDVEEALRCYELAGKLDPDLTRAVEPLAGLLSYMPE